MIKPGIVTRRQNVYLMVGVLVLLLTYQFVPANFPLYRYYNLAAMGMFYFTLGGWGVEDGNFMPLQ